MKPRPNTYKASNQRKVKPKRSAASLWQSHLETAKESLIKLLSAPAASVMTVVVIAISLLLPSGLYVTMQNLQGLSSGFNQLSPITLYLNDNVTEIEAMQVSDRLLQMTETHTARYVSKQQAATDFAIHSGLGDVLSELEINPLPASIVLTPISIDGEISNELLESLGAFAEVESVQVDLDWIARLQEFLKFAGRASNALMLVFSCAVLFVVGNTIRLSIEGRRAEIVVIKLVGGTDSYVARPFLYTGLWFGLAGGLLAWALLHIMLLALLGPMKQLLALYESQFAPEGLGLSASVVLLVLAAGLGWLGAWVSVRQHLKDIEPR